MLNRRLRAREKNAFYQHSRAAAARARQRRSVHWRRGAGVESLEDRIMLALVSWDGDAQDGRWMTAANWSGNQLPTPDDDVVIDVPTSETIVLRGDVQVRSVRNAEELQVTSDINVHARLSTVMEFTNTGTLVLSSTRADRTTTLVVGTELVNAAAGRLRIDSAGGGGRSLSGKVTNQGAIEVRGEFESRIQPV